MRHERRRELDVSSRVLSELASREAALDGQIEAAREEARRQAEEGAQLTRERAGGQVQQAAEYILRAVLP